MFEVDIWQALISYVDTPGDIPIDDQMMKEILLQQEATEKEMKVSQRVQASALEEVNFVVEGIALESKTILVVEEMLSSDKQRLIGLLNQYNDVFAWSFENMKGLDPVFCQHQINLHKDAKLVQQRRYRLNPNYVIKVKEELDKLLKVGFIHLVKKVTWLSQIVVVSFQWTIVNKMHTIVGRKCFLKSQLHNLLIGTLSSLFMCLSMHQM